MSSDELHDHSGLISRLTWFPDRLLQALGIGVPTPSGTEVRLMVRPKLYECHNGITCPCRLS